MLIGNDAIAFFTQGVNFGLQRQIFIGVAGDGTFTHLVEDALKFFDSLRRELR